MQKSSPFRGRLKFIIGGALIMAAIAYLIISATKANAEYFMTVNEIKSEGSSLLGRNLRISGAVVGDTISYDPQAMNLTFEIANVPGDNATIDKEGGLITVLHEAVTDPLRARLTIIYNGAKPDLLQNEAQAIITGHLNENGTFSASELLLKCPTKYQDAVPSQVNSGK